MTGEPHGPDRWVRPDQRSDLRPGPRSLQVAAILLLGLGGILSLAGMALVVLVASFQLDPELEGQLDLEAVGTMATIGTLATFGGVAQVGAGIGVARLRPSGRVTGIVAALLGAIAFGLAAVFSASGALERFLRDAQISGPEAVVLCLSIAGGYLIAAVALSNDWPVERR